MASLVIDFYNPVAFRTENYRYVFNPEGMIINSLALLLGDYEISRKHAALVILKVLLREKFLKSLLNDSEIHPFDRNDPRVKKWIKEVISIGRCQKCGSTENLEAHHIIRWADYPAGRIDKNNGICLCKVCHIDEHRYDDIGFMSGGGKSGKTYSKTASFCRRISL